MTKKIFGSIASVLCGWVIGWICLVAIYFFGNHQYLYIHFSNAIWDDLGLFVLMSFFIVPSWFFAFGPLYVFVPRTSFFWRWYICVPVGGLAGPVILLSPVAYSELYVYHASITDVLSTWPLSLPAAVVGAASCIFSILTFDYFNPNPTWLT